MMAAPPVRLLVDHDDHCQVLVTDALGAVSPVLKAVAEGWSPGDDDTVLNMRGRVVLCTPPAPIVELFLAFLVREDEVAPLALLPHTAPLIEVADFLAVDIDEQFKKERWIGPRTTASAMYARTQLARRAKCLFFVKNLLNAWFDYFSCTPQICFVTKRAVPHHHFKNELDASVDGKPFMNVLDAPNNHVPVVVAGRLPPSSATLSSEEGAGNLQREWMNDIYQLCADDEGRDLLVRSISCHPLKVRALVISWPSRPNASSTTSKSSAQPPFSFPPSPGSTTASEGIATATATVGAVLTSRCHDVPTKGTLAPTAADGSAIAPPEVKAIRAQLARPAQRGLLALRSTRLMCVAWACACSTPPRYVRACLNILVLWHDGRPSVEEGFESLTFAL